MTDTSTRDASFNDGETSEASRQYSYGLMDEAAKKEIRRACLRAVAIPGYQVPFASREMPIARGFGTGGLQITLSIIGPGDTLKVIDQGSDDSVNAVSLRSLIEKVCPGANTTEDSDEATIVQTRHRIPETILGEHQVLVFQVPYPDILGGVEMNEERRVQLHGETDYASLYVALYEDVVRNGRITSGAGYPVEVNRHYAMTPSPIPRWDVPRLSMSHNLNLFGAGREKKIFAVPPYTEVTPIQFSDQRFSVESFLDRNGERIACARCGSTGSFLDEIYLSDGATTFMCSDTEYCRKNAEGVSPVPSGAVDFRSPIPL
jgi:alpha-D-ribose 1-methylphosphonate 5-phosphate C-P lyase